MKKFFLPFLFLLCVSLLPAQTPKPMHIALLIDDGPTPDQLEKFLELFKREKIHATFSFVAKNVEAHPQPAKTAIAAGHEIANHSYEHLHPAGLDQKALDHEVLAALDVLETKIGVRPTWYWPPFVEITPDLEKTVAKTTMKIFRPGHLVSSSDWDISVSADQLRKNALTNVKDGTVILFHEWRKETLEQMPAILADLKRNGAVFLTISELANYLTNTKPLANAHR
ncbi:MAG: polysaccharide deacetylase family protein [Nibricoccus sp.]